ncbi:MAG: SUMF1/EgtB/PvdO family nonheme iron enzyme, partial [Roseimicrobium sp.]
GENYRMPELCAAVGIAQNLSRLDVLVSEGYLGGQFSGFELRDAIRQRFPGLRTVFTSRYDLTGYEAFFEQTAVLYEPLTAERLLSEVTGQTATTAVAVTVATVESSAQAVLPDDESDTGPPVLSPGTKLGSYAVKERLYAERDTETYLAVQQGVQREVALVLLRPELVSDAAVLARFRERERVKASIGHPRIAPLYEALQIDGHHFYTREMPNGRSVGELQATDEKLSEKLLVDIIAHVADAMHSATQRGHDYRMLSPRDVFIADENQASIVNVFRPAAETSRDYVADTKRLLMMLRTLADGPRARHTLDDLAKENLAWEGLRTRAGELQDQHRERSLLKRADAHEASDIQAAQAGSMPVWMIAASAAVVLVLLVGIFVRNAVSPPPPPPLLKQEMVHIAEGKFSYQKEKSPRRLNAFWIDKYEVTIGQYAEFLDALRADPKRARSYDHADQARKAPEKTGHEPEDWAPYLQAAHTAGFFNNQPITLNCPVVNVDWWDAYAFAKWKRCRLPTETEWERAARGAEGRLYPWGNVEQPAAANLGADFDRNGKGGQKDGFNFWAPADKMPLDVSADGVVGLVGNVEEWTSTLGNHPEIVDLMVPIVRGGHFGLTSNDNPCTRRLFAQSATDATRARGFRTASDNAPAASTP